jgi:hypothetical protein
VRRTQSQGFQSKRRRPSGHRGALQPPLPYSPTLADLKPILRRFGQDYYPANSSITRGAGEAIDTSWDSRG